MENRGWTSRILPVLISDWLINFIALISFDRLRRPEEMRKRPILPRFNSTFRYTGTYTYHQTRQLLLDRPNPDFERVLSKRMTKTLDLNDRSLPRSQSVDPRMATIDVCQRFPWDNWNISFLFLECAITEYFSNVREYSREWWSDNQMIQRSFFFSPNVLLDQQCQEHLHPRWIPMM